jgi:hypothetical protein
LNTLIFFAVAVFLLLVLLAWALRGSRVTAKPNLAVSFEEPGRQQVTYLPQLLQALAQEDDEFLAREAGQNLRRRVRRERQRLALKYLQALRRDFEGLLRIAKIIASLSPEIGVGQEFERLRLTLIFLLRFRLIQMALYAGYAPRPQVHQLGNLLSGLSVRLEEAMKKLGERAALVAEMASPADRRRVGLA